MNKMNKINLKSLFITIMLISSFNSFAGNNDVIGKIYDIEETSMLDYIMSKLKEKQRNGEIKKMEDEFKKNVINSLNNPRGVNLPRATENKSYIYDPTVTLQKDIRLADGRVLYPVGTQFNPLKIRGLSKRIIFIDGRDDKQVKYAISLYKESGKRDKIILVNGSFIDVMKKYHVPVFYDSLRSLGKSHRTTLVNKFGIENLPSVVYQEKDSDHLIIKEVALK